MRRVAESRRVEKVLTGTPTAVVRSALLALEVPLSSVITLVLLLISTWAMSQQPQLAKGILDSAASGVNLDKVLELSAIVVIGLIASSMAGILAAISANKLAASIRALLSARLLAAPLNTYTRLSVADLATRSLNDVEVFKVAIQSGVIQLVSSVVMLVVCLDGMLRTDLGMAFTALTSGILSVIAVSVLSRWIKRATRGRQESLSGYAQELERCLRLVVTLKVHNALDYAFARIKRHIDLVQKKSDHYALISGASNPFVGALLQLILGATVAVGAYRVAEGDSTSGALVAFVMYCTMLFGPIGAVSNFITSQSSVAASHERLRELLRQVEPSAGTRDEVNMNAPFPRLPEKIKPIQERGSIEDGSTDVGLRLVDVCIGLSQPGAGQAKDIIRSLNLYFPGPGVYVLVAPSGAGKTTLLRALAGLVAPSRGRIRLGGVYQDQCTAYNWRTRVSLVEQSAPLFQGTIRENLSLGCFFTDSELWDSLREVDLTSRVVEMGGLDAPVGAELATLSGGEAQRMCVARALVRETRLYLCDEVTNSLDDTSAAKVRDALGARGRESIVIHASHDERVIAKADHVIRLQDVGDAEMTGSASC